MILDIHTLKKETSLNLDIVANSVVVGQNSLPDDRKKHANLIFMGKDHEEHFDLVY